MKYKNGQLAFLRKEVITSLSTIDSTVPNKASRPFCLIIYDPFIKNRLWAIPITSSNLDVYRKRAKRSPKRFKFYKVKGKINCFNLSKMFPIHVDEIHNLYKHGNSVLTIKPNETNELVHIIQSISSKDQLRQFLHYDHVDEILLDVEQREARRQNIRPTLSIYKPTKGRSL